MAALKYWVWLTALPGLSNRSRLLLLERYGSPEDVYYADAEELALTEGLTPGQASCFRTRASPGRTASWRTAPGAIFSC